MTGHLEGLIRVLSQLKKYVPLMIILKDTVMIQM